MTQQLYFEICSTNICAQVSKECKNIKQILFIKLKVGNNLSAPNTRVMIKIRVYSYNLLCSHWRELDSSKCTALKRYLTYTAKEKIKYSPIYRCEWIYLYFIEEYILTDVKNIFKCIQNVNKHYLQKRQSKGAGRYFSFKPSSTTSIWWVTLTPYLNSESLLFLFNLLFFNMNLTLGGA